MIIEFNRKTLYAVKACEEGHIFFDFVSDKTDVIVVDWQEIHYLWIAVNFPNVLNWLKQRKIIPTPNFSGLDLSNLLFNNCNFSGADFSTCKLTNTKFINCNLTGCNFSDTDLTSCTFT